MSVGVGELFRGLPFVGVCMEKKYMCLRWVDELLRGLPVDVCMEKMYMCLKVDEDCVYRQMP